MCQLALIKGPIPWWISGDLKSCIFQLQRKAYACCICMCVCFSPKQSCAPVPVSGLRRFSPFFVASGAFLNSPAGCTAVNAV